MIIFFSIIIFIYKIKNMDNNKNINRLIHTMVKEEIDLSSVNVPSSIDDACEKFVKVLRPGMLSKNQIANILNEIFLNLGLTKSDVNQILQIIQQDRVRYKF